MRHLTLLTIWFLGWNANAVVAGAPDVLFVAIDDLNDWIGCLGGHPQAETPHMDALAAQGVLFTNAHCVAPACNPSRAAVFSGRMPFTTGVWANQSDMKLDRLYPQGPLLSTTFGRSGYHTLGTGKLLHSGGRDSFDSYYAVEQRWSPLTKAAVKYTPAELPSKGSATPKHIARDAAGRTFHLPLNRMPSDRRPQTVDGESFDWGPFATPDESFGDTQITTWAIEQLQTPRTKPLFLAVGYYRPHIPLWAPKRFFDRFRSQPAELPEVLAQDLEDLGSIARNWALAPVTAGSHATVVKHQQWQAAVEAYLACVTYVDHELGRLLTALKASPRGRDTWIVLWSDHGWHLGEKQHWGKWTGWERSTKVPLIIVPPAHASASFARGARCTAPVSLIDLFPTLVELCELAPPEKLDGISLAPLIRQPSQKTNRAVLTTFNPGNVSLRTQRFRFLRYADGTEELYDHQTDPHEWHNLVDQPAYQDQLANMRARVRARLP